MSSPADVASKDGIITVVANSINATETYSGANGIPKKAKQGSLLTDSSTTDPIVWKDLAKEVEKMGAIFRVAPVSDGVEATQSGNLTFMVGGVLC